MTHLMKLALMTLLTLSLALSTAVSADPNKVKKLFKGIGKEMMEVPEFAADLLQPFKSQGVQSMEDSAIIVRGKFMAKPGEQFMIRKEVYRRVQEAFKEAGIEFAHRRVAVDPATSQLPDHRSHRRGQELHRHRARPQGLPRRL